MRFQSFLVLCSALTATCVSALPHSNGPAIAPKAVVARAAVGGGDATIVPRAQDSNKANEHAHHVGKNAGDAMYHLSKGNTGMAIAHAGAAIMHGTAALGHHTGSSNANRYSQAANRGDKHISKHSGGGGSSSR